MNHIISSKNTLVYDIYIKSRETNPWVKKLKDLLNGLGHSYIINNINSIKFNLNTIKQRIHDQCLQTQNANICDSQKLNFFQSVYNMGQRSPYVDVLNNRCDRAAICKIRVSAHPLMIERGRHLTYLEQRGIVYYVNQIKLKMKNIFSYIVKNSILKETY
jgi:hypothetical protein